MVDITLKLKGKKLLSKRQCCDDVVVSVSYNNRYEGTGEENNLLPGQKKRCKRINSHPIIFIKVNQSHKAITNNGKLNIILNNLETSGSKVKQIYEKEFLENISSQTFKDNAENNSFDLYTTKATTTAAFNTK